MEENEDAYKKQLFQYIKSKETPDIMEELSKNAHAAIGENLAHEKKAQERSLKKRGEIAPKCLLPRRKIRQLRQRQPSPELEWAAKG